MFGKYKKRPRTFNLWNESAEGMSGKGVPAQDMEQEEEIENEEEEEIKEQRVIEVSVNKNKGERKQYYEAMVKLEESNMGLQYYINDRVATIIVEESKVDQAVEALTEAGLTDLGVYNRQFDPNEIG